MNYETMESPKILYHGTVSKNIESIKEKGLLKGNRLYVYLSGNYETAIKVGTRRGTPIILTIDAQKMYEDGFKFRPSKDNTWLCDDIPPKYIFF